MKALLDRLVACDSEHFRTYERGWQFKHPGHDRWGYWSGTALDKRRECLWIIAGWCLEQMQARWRELIYGAQLPDPEFEALNRIMPEKCYEATPGRIIEAYCEWREACKVAA